MSEHTTTFAAVAAALMLVLAGCAGGVPSTDGSGAGTTEGGDGGTVNFYVSDQQNAIGDFEHLNVTVEKVVLVRADGDENETEVESEDDADADDANETETNDATETDDADTDDRVVYNVENVTVDLTELQGANATQLGSIPAPNGTYTKVFVHVSDVNGTLADGSSADVKLPSNKLRLNKQFTVGNGQEVDFVFDVTVFERGPNGYILKPVAGESGTADEVEIRDVDDDTDDEESDDAAESDDADDADDVNETESDDEADADDDGDDASESSNASDAGDSGQASMAFYLSDEQNAMGDFEHLNVTVTKVGLHRADGGWVERDVDDRTVDLTTLPGANATRLGTFGVENGTYDKVFVYVDGIDATLENGESTRVKLPSSKLQLNTEFTVGNGEEVDFVYDMSVFEAGNSGKYILKPVVSESGTSDEVPIEDVDENETDDEDDRESLNASFVGNVSTDANATVEVTRNGSAVENVSVTVAQEADDETTTTTYTTGDNGTVTFFVAENTTELTVEATDSDQEAELEREFETEDDESDETETADLNATFVGTVSAGANATVEVTQNESAVENATVTVSQTVDGELSAQTYATDANGTVTFGIDANATDLTVVVVDDDEAVELEREFESDEDDDADTTGNGNSGGNNGNGNGNAALQFAA